MSDGTTGVVPCYNDDGISIATDAATTYPPESSTSADAVICTLNTMRPFGRRNRVVIKNQPISRAELHVRSIERNYCRVLQREQYLAGLSSEQRELRVLDAVLFWQRSADLLIHESRVLYRSRIGRSRTQWGKLAKRVLRYHDERLYFHGNSRDGILNDLIEPWLRDGILDDPIPWGQFPATWPSLSRRRTLRCLVCISDCIRNRRVWRIKRPAKSIQVWEVRSSTWCSLRHHVITCHADMQGHRICSVCAKICASPEGCVMHQTLKHCAAGLEQQQQQPDDGYLISWLCKTLGSHCGSKTR